MQVSALDAHVTHLQIKRFNKQLKPRKLTKENFILIRSCFTVENQ